MKKIAPYGSWTSPITPAMVGGKVRRLAHPQLLGERIFWLESRPEEQGRNTIMMSDMEGHTTSLLNYPLSSKSYAHEYGGGSYCVDEDKLYFVSAEDQRIYSLNYKSTADNQIQALTAPHEDGQYRYADLSLDPHRQRLLAVCEEHSLATQYPKNYLVSVSTHRDNQPLQVLAEGHDFYSSPQISPDGEWLCFLTWDQPNMPWDGTQCWLGHLNPEGLVDNLFCIAGGNTESIFQPQWSPRGQLYFVSDRSNWWNIYRFDLAKFLSQHASTTSDHKTINQYIETITELEAEFATPQWTFGMSTYGFLNENTLLATYTQHSLWHLTSINLEDKSLNPIVTELNHLADIACTNDHAVLLGGSPNTPQNFFLYDSHKLQCISNSTDHTLSNEIYSTPQAIQFPSSNNHEAFAFFYPPHNPEYSGPNDDKPPVIVICHGGPTGSTNTLLNLKIQFWTSRGFAVLDINYRGSTGYGRQYREQLYYQWGIRDVEDTYAAVKYAEEQGWIHSNQKIIKGSSAGGYTILAALVKEPIFNAGVSLYGVGNLETLAQDTHKFEARYLDRLVGDYPQEKDTYKARSPIYHLSQIQCPVLIFQGLKDKIVPPEQAETIVSALKANHVPVVYITYPNEGHGFQSSDTLINMLETELEFYLDTFNIKTN